MVTETLPSDNLDTKYKFEKKSGQTIINRRPVFSPDGQSLAIIVQNIVRVYNIETGDCARILETECQINELVGLEFPENQSYNLYGCSDNGCITIWTWEKGAVLREIELNLKPRQIITTFNLIDINECFITYISSKERIIKCASYSLKTGVKTCLYHQTTPLYLNVVQVSLGWCYGDRYAAICNGTKMLFIQNLYKSHVLNQIINQGNFRIMAVSAHPKENALAVTDALGIVTIIRGNLYDNKSLGREKLHWHFLPVLSVCFSIQGSYIYSGGLEKVLVKWTLGNLASSANEKEFIPRLPGTIRFIAVSSSHIALTLTNNAVVIANTQMRVVSTILECGGLSPAARTIGTSFVYHKPLDALLMGGRTGHLQLLSTTTNKVIFNIDITGLNPIPPQRTNLLPLETEVTCAAVSAKGNWLVTSEYRNDGVYYPEEKLKFWSLRFKKSPPFILNTCVNLSHNGCNVVALVLNHNGKFCVSAGNDQKFRIWKREVNGKVSFWSCLTACYYSSGMSQFLSHGILNFFKNNTANAPGKVEDLPYMKENHKDDCITKLFNIHQERITLDEDLVNAGMKKVPELNIGGVAISQDGSLIAAWFGSKLTLWDSHTCNLRSVLSHPVVNTEGIHVAFGNNDAAHYLVSTTAEHVVVWSLLSLTVKWLVKINPRCLAVDSSSNKMAVVNTFNDVFVFTPHSSTPILIKRRLLPTPSGVFSHCTFGATINDDIKLYLVRNDTEIYTLEPIKSEQTALEVLSHRSLPMSNFSALLAETQLSEVSTVKVASLQALNLEKLGNSAISQFLSAAPHMIPPVSLLCTAFLQHVSGKVEKEIRKEKEEDLKVDSHSSDDEDSKQKVTSNSNGGAIQMWAPNYEKIKDKKLKKVHSELFLDLIQTASIFDL